MSAPLLLLPGLLCDARVWARVGEALPGVALVHGDIAQADSVPGIAGLSMGGIVALEMWRQAPARIERLALVDTTAAPDANPHREAQVARARRRAGGAGVRRPETAYVHADARVMATIMAMALDAGPGVFERQSRALTERATAGRRCQRSPSPRSCCAAPTRRWTRLQRNRRSPARL